MDDSPFDHRGRARPMFARNGGGAPSWRPSRLARVALGLFPGLRVMAVASALAGLPYLLLGIVSVLMATLLLLEWDIAQQSIRTFRIQEVWLLAHAAAIVSAVVVFEMLRFGAALEERYYGSRAPRFLAALLLPALVVVLWAPQMVQLWPQLIEATWLAALVMVIGSLPAAIWTAAEGFLMSSDRLRNFQIGVGVSMLVLLVGAVVLLLGAGGIRGGLHQWAVDVGFVVLPRVLGGA